MRVSAGLDVTLRAPASIRAVLALGLALAFACACERDDAGRSRGEAPPTAPQTPATKPPAIKPPAETARPEPVTSRAKAAAVDVAGLRIPTPPGWSAAYSSALQSWTVSRDATAAGDAAAADRFYVDAFPEGMPTDLDAYADALQTDPDFQDEGYLFVEIDRKEQLPTGWVIAGASKDTSSGDAEPRPSFVLLHATSGVYCHSGTFVDARSRDDAIEICRGIEPAAPARP